MISAAVNVANVEDVEGEDVEDEEGVLPNCVNLLVESLAISLALEWKLLRLFFSL